MAKHAEMRGVVQDYNYDDEEPSAAFTDISAQYGSVRAAEFVSHPPTTPTATEKPRIVMMGLRRSGKSSIVKVVFHKMSPNETLFLESTSKIQKSGIASNSFVHFDVWDFPGQIDFFESTFDSDEIFGNCGALVFVIDAQEEDDHYSEALEKLHETVKQAYKVNKKIKFEVFIHKVDGLSDDHKIERQDHIHQRAVDDLAEAHLKDDIHLSFYLTSIYDHSIFEAFSKVVQKLVPQMGTLESLLDMLLSSCRLEKTFLIDVVSKLYIASDSSPVDMQSYELCSDMIDVCVDISCIYGNKDELNPLAYDDQSRSIIKLNNGMVIYLREMTRYLALVCLMREENFDKHGVLEYNFGTLRDAIHKVFDRPRKTVKQRI